MFSCKILAGFPFTAPFLYQRLSNLRNSRHLQQRLQEDFRLQSLHAPSINQTTASDTIPIGHQTSQSTSLTTIMPSVSQNMQSLSTDVSSTSTNLSPTLPNMDPTCQLSSTPSPCELPPSVNCLSLNTFPTIFPF